MRSGVYSTRSGYFAAAELEHNRVNHQATPDWKSLLWSCRVTPNCKSSSGRSHKEPTYNYEEHCRREPTYNYEACNIILHDLIVVN
ncbi:hypothetical protein F2Q69_00013706 [Brassica cretica]|uniref:Uncharacterized protein n=1 Tax=Brassica cretica TaxID=69181 RepID=A0A8S9QPR4_BRACR|nr:hypothetical protein F2Q69_00013706 [Brassica cretica]